jgi:hypothetical protein
MGGGYFIYFISTFFSRYFDFVENRHFVYGLSEEWKLHKATRVFLGAVGLLGEGVSVFLFVVHVSHCYSFVFLHPMNKAMRRGKDEKRKRKQKKLTQVPTP